MITVCWILACDTPVPTPSYSIVTGVYGYVPFSVPEVVLASFLFGKFYFLSCPSPGLSLIMAAYCYPFLVFPLSMFFLKEVLPQHYLLSPPLLPSQVVEPPSSGGCWVFVHRFLNFTHIMPTWILLNVICINVIYVFFSS